MDILYPKIDNSPYQSTKAQITLQTWIYNFNFSFSLNSEKEVSFTIANDKKGNNLRKGSFFDNANYKKGKNN